MSNVTNSESPRPVRGGEGAYSGLCLSATLLLVAGTAGTFAASCMVGGITGTTLAAITLILALASITAGLSAHAGRLRYRLVEAAGWKPPQWGHAETSADLENPYILEFEQARSIHFWLLGLIPVSIVLTAAVFLFLGMNKGTSSYFEFVAPETMLLGIFGFIFSCIWLIFARSFETIASDDLPEAAGLSSTMREIQIICLVTAIAFIAKSWIGPSEAWLTRVLIVWSIIVGVELFFRLLMGWLNRSSSPTQFSSPLDLTSRNIIFVLGNPVAGLFNTLESKYGISFRSSWAIRFVARATVPALIMVFFLSWLLTCLAVVRLGEMGVRQNCGVVAGEPLTPGLYVKLPWPLGQITTYPVKRVSSTSIGFEHNEESEHHGGALHAYLWTETHGKEFGLLLGNGDESITVNAMVNYKIREDKDGFFQYVFSFKNPDEAISAFGYQALMEVTRSKTVNEVLSIDRNAFTESIKNRVVELCQENKLGVEITDVFLLNLHPPVAIAKEYLDVISAKIDAKTATITAEGNKDSAVLIAQRDSKASVIKAKIESLQKISTAQRQSSEFIAVGEAYKIAPEAFKTRYWLTTIEQSLSNKKLVLIDKNLPLFWNMNKQEKKKNPVEGLIQAE